jgi:hypothetical protein
MTDPHATPQASAERAAHERCLCHEFMEEITHHLGVSPEVKQHLANSRIELLKALRQVLDERIQRLASKARPGTKIAVE